MLVFILFINFSPVKTVDVTDNGTHRTKDRNVCIESVFPDYEPQTSCNRSEPNVVSGRQVSASYPLDDQPDNERPDYSPWLEHINTCQKEQKDKTLKYRSPEYMWGKEFNSSIGKTLCEACVSARGNRIEAIRFSRRGLNTCSKVCNKQDQNILRVAPSTVVLKDFYCTKRRLVTASCVCVFKVTCRENRHFVFIQFIPNRNGNVAMLYFEAGHPM